MGKKSLAALLCATMAMTACMLPATAAMADEPLKIEFFQQKGEEGPQKCLSGIDAAICVSAQASDKEKDAAYRFLSYLADPENAQIFCDNDGAPSCITGVTSNDDGIKPMVDMINAGKTHDWMASTIDNNVTTDLYNVVQGFWANKDVDAVMKDMDASIEISSAQ